VIDGLVFVDDGISGAEFERLRVRAFEERCSVGEVIRRGVAEYLSKGEGVGKLLGKRRGQ
jgi:hypothetical protein